MDVEDSMKKLRLKLVLEFMLSPTYFLADYNKSKYRINDKSITKLIQKFNIIYLAIATIVALTLYLFSPVEIYGSNLGDTFKWFALVMIWMYPLSRANEIIFAFYRDAIEKLNGEPSKSTLKFGERIQLAMRSYIELILNFASIYILLPPHCYEFKITNYLEALYFSGVTITTLGYGDISPKCVLPQMLSIYEVLCGFMLIVVSFAVYTGRGLEKKSE